MSYAVQQPTVEAPRRPVTVGLAAALLAVMGVGGLVYAVATLAVTPGVVDRFRQGSAAADSADVDGLVTVVWVGAAIGTVLAVILFALYLVLALGLRRGSHGSRIGVWVLSGLGLLAGCATTATVLIEHSGYGTPGSLGTTLSDAYPGGWIGLNLGLAIAQIVGYAVVAVLLVVSPGAYFGRRPAQPPATPTYGGIPSYGATSPYGPPAGYGPPQPGYGPPQPGYGPPQPGYGPPQPGYGPPPGYGQPSPGAPLGYSSPGGPPGYQPPPGYAPSPGPAVPAPGTPGPAAPPPSAQPAPGSEDEFWSRPSE
jgi:hypothetical protein